MKRTWEINRQFQAHPEGTVRWDRAYQSILQWALTIERTASSEPDMTSESAKEAENANRRLRPSFYPTTSPKSNH